MHLHKGCQVLSGGQALAYVRDRHSFATQDLQREQDQRLFLKSLLTKLTSTGVMLNPFKALPAATGTVHTLTVDEGASLFGISTRRPRRCAAPRRPQSRSRQRPYATSAGDAVLWNSTQAKELFNDLNTGQAVPKNLITGSKQGG